MKDEATYQCDSCGEEIIVPIDLAAGSRQEYVEDCPVCCCPQQRGVVAASIREIERHAEVAELVGADVVNIHGGGAFGDKGRSLADFARNLSRLASRARNRLTVENDDRIYSPADLLHSCWAEGVPKVYDVHHHRCNPDELSKEEATEQTVANWDRELLFYISSPVEDWKGPKQERHHDFIDVKGFPTCWQRLVSASPSLAEKVNRDDSDEQGYENDSGHEGSGCPR